MNIIDSFAAKIRDRNFTIALPEGNDERIVQVARRLKDQRLAEPIVLGSPDQIETAARASGTSLDGIVTINPKTSDKLDVYAEIYARGRDDLSIPVAKRVVVKPVFFAAMMVKCGHADTAVGGVAHATATLIQAGTLTVGLLPGINTASSYFLMIIPNFLGQGDKPLIYADCAVNINPTSEQLADIAIASAESARRILGDQPKVAMLSFSTRGSASGPDVDKVKNALEIAKTRRPDLVIDGEFQLDAAVVPRVAAKKVKDGSPVAGQANVIIFPDLNSGNIGYKLTQYMANAQAIGPFLQGFAKPITDLSRGASVDDIVSTAVLTLVQLL